MEILTALLFVFFYRLFGLTPVGIGSQQCDYNLAPLFEDRRAGPLAKQVLELKLEETGWTSPGNDDFRRDFSSIPLQRQMNFLEASLEILTVLHVVKLKQNSVA